MRGQDSYCGMSAPECRNVRFQENPQKVGFMAEDYDDPSPPFNRIEDTTNYVEDQSFPLDGSLSLNARFQH